MKSGFRFAIAFGLSTCLTLALHGQGSLTPPGAPAPTMKSLAQIEPRTAISSAPFTISTPGAYYLTTNVTTTVSNAIVINVSGVTLDLNGFTISSTVANAASGGTAILINGALTDIAIYNGHIVSGVTTNAGIYSGSGFSNGILYPTNSVTKNIRINGVTVLGCLAYGIGLPPRNSTLVESCTVQTAGTTGISASVVKSCTAMNCGVTAIDADIVSDCMSEAPKGIGIFAEESANNCVGLAGGDYAIQTSTANNCYGYGTNVYGAIYANTAMNCVGVGKKAFGISASTMAVNCYGVCLDGGFGFGIKGMSIQNCSGTADVTSGIGISGTTIVNSIGYASYRGIYVEPGGVVSQCQAASSTIGIYAQPESKVADCSAYENNYGIYLLGYNMVTGNFVSKNTLSGIYGNASNGNYVDGNLAVQNNTSNTGAQGGIALINCTNNIIIRNSATANGVTGFNVTGVNTTGGYFSVAGTTISTTSPWANFLY